VFSKRVDVVDGVNLGVCRVIYMTIDLPPKHDSCKSFHIGESPRALESVRVANPTTGDHLRLHSSRSTSPFIPRIQDSAAVEPRRESLSMAVVADFAWILVSESAGWPKGEFLQSYISLNLDQSRTG
jgi:hypothetical protein